MSFKATYDGAAFPEFLAEMAGDPHSPAIFILGCFQKSGKNGPQSLLQPGFSFIHCNAYQLLFAVAAHIMMTMIAVSSAITIAIALLVTTALLIAL